MDPDGSTEPEARDTTARRTIECPTCGHKMRFEGGSSTHDLWAERYRCPSCGREEYRSFGRGSVS